MNKSNLGWGIIALTLILLGVGTTMAQGKKLPQRATYLERSIQTFEICMESTSMSHIDCRNTMKMVRHIIKNNMINDQLMAEGRRAYKTPTTTAYRALLRRALDIPAMEKYSPNGALVRLCMYNHDLLLSVRGTPVLAYGVTGKASLPPSVHNCKMAGVHVL